VNCARTLLRRPVLEIGTASEAVTEKSNSKDKKWGQRIFPQTKTWITFLENLNNNNGRIKRKPERDSGKEEKDGWSIR